jgi:hypothetical protein
MRYFTVYTEPPTRCADRKRTRKGAFRLARHLLREGHTFVCVAQHRRTREGTTVVREWGNDGRRLPCVYPDSV